MSEADGVRERRLHLIRPVRRGNAFEETVEHLLSALSAGIFAPGERLPAERALADQLGVSRATLREALSELQRAEYLRVERGRYGGAVVADEMPATPRRAPLGAEELEDVLTFRAVVEPAAAELAARRADPAGLEHLRDTLDASIDCEPAQFRALDARFHLAVAELTGSSRLTTAVAQARAATSDLLDRIPMLAANIAHSDEQHRAIVAAITAADADGARERMAEHVRGTESLLRGFLTGP